MWSLKLADGKMKLRELLIRLESKLLLKLNFGHMTGAAYDTAQALRFTGGLQFPRSLVWLLSNQHEDGSWGASHLYYHDRVLATLAAIIALTEIDREKFSRRIRAGEDFLWDNVYKLREEKYDTVGFELLYPTLTEEAFSLGLNVPSFEISYYLNLMNKKLVATLSESIYSGRTTLTFSLEMLGENLDKRYVKRLVAPNGSVACSPSATAFVLRHAYVEKCIEYLKEVENMNSDGSFMDVYPFEVFEKAWVLFNYILAEEAMNDLLYSNVRYLASCWGEEGVGISRYSGVTDSDDTAMVFKVLTEFGRRPDPKVFSAFEAKDRFFCFRYERDPSVSANIHILDALLYCKRSKEIEEWIEKALAFLNRTMLNREFWLDKWHISPYYSTSHAIIALSKIDTSLADKAVGWIIATQNEDGSWGSNGGTAEETAYCLQALLYYKKFEKVGEDEIRRGTAYLLEHLYDPSYPPLWIGKGLYAPINVVRSAVVSALHMVRKSGLVSE